MLPAAVGQAKNHLASARKAIECLSQAKSFKVVQEHWSNFLRHSNIVFSKLEQGSKVGSSNGWYDSIKHLRKTDEALSYIHQARNAEEHGLEPVTQMTAPQLSSVPAGYVVPDAKQGKELLIQLAPGHVLKVDLPTGVQLVPVRNRGRTYPVPDSHMGKVRQSSDMIEFANSLADTIEDIIKQAESYVVR